MFHTLSYLWDVKTIIVSTSGPLLEGLATQNYAWLGIISPLQYFALCINLGVSLISMIVLYHVATIPNILRVIKIIFTKKAKMSTQNSF